MFCIYCNKEANGKFCAICGNKNISSKKEWEYWKSTFSQYDKDKLEHMISCQDDYQDDAVAAAMYLRDNFKETPEYEVTEPIWYYTFKGESIGPVSTEQLFDMYVDGDLLLTSIVWREGFKEWTRLDQAGIALPELNTNTPPPLPVKNINNKAIIFMLFVPIISTIIQYVVAGIFNENVTKLWWIAYGLNSLCCCIDYYRLKKAGYDASGLMAAFIFLIPIYLYKRTALVKGKKWLITFLWIGVFVVDLLIPDLFWIKTIGLSNPSVIEMVKGGSFNDYPDTKLETLFNYTIENCEWNTFVGADRRVFVSVSGQIDESEIKITFEILDDTSYEISSMRIDGENCTIWETNAVIESLYENYSYEQNLERLF